MQLSSVPTKSVCDHGKHGAAEPQPNEGLRDHGILRTYGRRRTRIATRCNLVLLPCHLRSAWGDQFSGHSQGNSGFCQIFRQVLECGNGACAVAAFDMEPRRPELSRAVGLADAKAVNRYARHRSPRRCRVHRSLVKFFSSGCFSSGNGSFGTSRPSLVSRKNDDTNCDSMQLDPSSANSVVLLNSKK